MQGWLHFFECVRSAVSGSGWVEMKESDGLNIGPQDRLNTSRVASITGHNRTFEKPCRLTRLRMTGNGLKVHGACTGTFFVQLHAEDGPLKR